MASAGGGAARATDTGGVAARSWHPPRALLELAELVVDGALPRLPQESLAGLDLPVVLDDAEGTPVARIAADGTVAADRPFAHGPLRSRRRRPAQVREELAAAGDVLAVPVRGPLTRGQVGEIAEVARRGHDGLLWLPMVGAGRPGATAGGLPPEGLWRALCDVAGEVGGIVVPLALPAGYDDLLHAVALAHGATTVVDVGALAPVGAAHPAFARELARATPPPAERGAVLLFTGLSGSGKSTVSRALAERLLDDGRRRVTMLDGDEVRRLLSHGLGFSRADRDLNIRRIGFVAAEVSRHGGLAICAPIAPFAAVRAEVRELVEDAGGVFLLVHVATPLEECERRDRKGLYARARRGEIADFTGISSPYEEPTDADLVLDTTGLPVEDCVDAVWRVLQGRGLLPE